MENPATWSDDAKAIAAAIAEWEDQQRQGIFGASIVRVIEDAVIKPMRESGAGRIAAERVRQVKEEGWTAEHDKEHLYGELSAAGICYARIGSAQCRHFNGTISFQVPPDWPWSDDWWKPSPDRIRNLVRAGALIAAEIDRLESHENSN